MTVTNPAESLGCYSYPDVTQQAEYLAEMLSQTIKKSLPEEIRFLERLGSVRRAAREIIDMPDRLLDSLLMRLHRNNGTLAKQQREGEFKLLTDDELARIQKAFRETFEM